MRDDTPAVEAPVNSIYYQQLADNGRRLSIHRTYHRCNKKPLNTIKTLRRLECFHRAPQLWENEFLYRNNKEPFEPSSHFFPPPSQDGKKFSHVFSLLQRKKKFCFRINARLSLPICGGKNWGDGSRRRLLIRKSQYWTCGIPQKLRAASRSETKVKVVNIKLHVTSLRVQQNKLSEIEGTWFILNETK